jgi:protein-L-isoaspartate(D-aspartate) O-methyltransferase
MAWRSHGTDNDSLVDALVRNRVLKTKKVIDAMRRVDRGNYCLPFSGESAYEDHPLPIGSNATISAPHMHAACLELAHDRIKENSRVLDVGSGSGYLTSCFAAMLDHHDTYAAGSIRAEEVEDRRPGLNDTNYPIVVGVEHIQELVDFSIENTKKDGKGKYLAGPEPLVVLKLADGREGYPPYAPFDVIHVGAASPEKPTKLLKQLANGGRLICPVGTGWQSLRVYNKDEKGNVSEFDAMGVSYVPLTSAKAQTERSSGFFSP